MKTAATVTQFVKLASAVIILNISSYAAIFIIAYPVFRDQRILKLLNYASKIKNLEGCIINSNLITINFKSPR